jgi:hypothetical protein
LAILALCVSVCGCKPGLKEASGKDTIIVVVCSDEDWQLAGAALDSAFAVTENAVQALRVFELDHVKPKNLELYRYRKNILLMGTINSDMMKEVLSQDAKVMVGTGESYMFGSLDAWIENQIAVMIAAPAEKPLDQIVRLSGRSAYEFFKRNSLERIRRRMYSSGTEEEIKAQMMRKCGWSLDVPRGWRVSVDDSIRHAFSLVKHSPESVVSVYWGFEKGKKGWVDIRDEFGSMYLQGDKVDRARSTESPVTFKGYNAVRLEGNWENDKKGLGGPFVSYCFQDTASGKYYVVDYSAFAPGENKWPIMGQMEWIVQTFKIYH